MKKLTRAIDGYYSESQFAHSVGLTVFGIRRWRKRGYGPQPVKFGRSVFYSEAEVHDFLTRNSN